MPKTASAVRTYRFDQMATMINDRVDDPSESGVERYVGLEHLDADSLRIRRWGDITDVESTKLRFQPGDIIFGKRRVYQRKLAVADFEGICSAHAMVLRARPEVVVPEFLPFFMQSDLFMERALAISVGSLSPTINWTDLAAQEFALPPIEEQERRVAACTAAEACFATLHELTEASRVTWLATIQQCEDRYVSDLKPLGDLLTVIESGRSVVGSDKPPSNGEYAVLKVSAVDPFGFQPHESKVLLDQTHFMPEHSVCAGDLLITRSNTPALVGETCIVDRDYPNLMLCDKTLRLVPKSDVSKSTLWHMLQSNRVRQQIAAVATGTGGAMKNISQPKINALRVCVPPNEKEAKAVGTRLNECFHAFRQCRARELACTAFQRSLLNVLLAEEV